MALPDKFNGTASKADAFFQQVYLYTTANQDVYNTNEDKIMFILSFMKSGVAGCWANVVVDEAMASTTTSPWGTYATFLAKAKKVFVNPNKLTNTQHQLTNLQQGTETVEEFFVEFEQAWHNTGYSTGYNPVLIKKLDLAVNKQVVDKIYDLMVIPTTYNDYKKKAINLNNNQCCLVSMCHMHSSTLSTPSTSKSFSMNKPLPPWPDSSPSKPVVTKKDLTGTIFGGKGQPMVIDQAAYWKESCCFNCHKTRHIARDCPEKKSLDVHVVKTESIEDKDDLIIRLMATIQEMKEKNLDFPDNTEWIVVLMSLQKLHLPMYFYQIIFQFYWSKNQQKTSLKYPLQDLNDLQYWLLEQKKHKFLWQLLFSLTHTPLPPQLSLIAEPLILASTPHSAKRMQFPLFLWLHHNS
jgi:hypothetical protein